MIHHSIFGSGRPERGLAARRLRVGGTLVATVTLMAGMSACLPSESSTSEAPSAAEPSETIAAAPAEPGETPPFVVPPFEGPEPAPVRGGTTFTYWNPGSETDAGPPPSDYSKIEYTIPAGWEADDIYIGKHLGQPNEVALSFWTTAGVYPDPCHRTDAELSPLDLDAHGHQADGALVLQGYPEIGMAAQQGRMAAEPRELVLVTPPWAGGTRALRFELSVSDDLDVASCDDGIYRAWPYFAAQDRGNDNHLPGQTDIVYQVDLDRSPLLIDASYRLASSPKDIEELYSVLGSLVIHR